MWLGQISSYFFIDYFHGNLLNQPMKPKKNLYSLPILRFFSHIHTYMRTMPHFYLKIPNSSKFETFTWLTLRMQIMRKKGTKNRSMYIVMKWCSKVFWPKVECYWKLFKWDHFLENTPSAPNFMKISQRLRPIHSTQTYVDKHQTYKLTERFRLNQKIILNRSI